jgi:hypothetical protein
MIGFKTPRTGSYLAGEDLSLWQFKAVKFDTVEGKVVKYQGSGNPCGILQNVPYGVDYPCEVAFPGGAAKWIADAGVTAGVPLKVTATGTCAAASAGDSVMGFADAIGSSATSAGDVIAVDLDHASTLNAGPGYTTVSTWADLVAAVAAAAANDVILLAAATFTATSKLTITKPMTLQGIRPSGDHGAILNAGSLASEMVLVELAAQSASAEVVFKDIYCVGTAADQDNVRINNTNVAQKLKVRFENCISEVTAACTGYGLNVLHASSAKEIQVKITGAGWHRFQNVYFTVGHNNDSLNAEGMRFGMSSGVASDLITSAGAFTLQALFVACEFTKDTATSGGHADHWYGAFGCYTQDGSAIARAVAVAGDFDATGTELISP